MENEKKAKGRPRLTSDGVSLGKIKKREAARVRAEHEYYTDEPKSQWAKAAYRDAQRRAKSKSLDCTITLQDIIDLANDSDICPMTGMELDYSRGEGYRPNSPTVDRIDNRNGYETGNCHIISRDANTAKARLTIAQLVAVGDWARKRQQAELQAGEDRLAKLMAAFFDVVESFDRHARNKIDRRLENDI